MISKQTVVPHLVLPSKQNDVTFVVKRQSHLNNTKQKQE